MSSHTILLVSEKSYMIVLSFVYSIQQNWQIRSDSGSHRNNHMWQLPELHSAKFSYDLDQNTTVRFHVLVEENTAL